MLYAKGADMMMERDCNVQIPAACREHVNSFACEGLRTLVVAEKEIPAAECAAGRKTSGF
jgi:magnesium-transporting ATPase (P-type)